ncbi:MAG: PilZ domain-containing protein [Planctomycetota bacterium]|nr:PilZ domain-containing protein [Planctomycetota bacterium]
MSSEQRKHERFPTHYFVSVQVPREDKECEGNCRDLSEGGMFIGTEEPLPRGTEVKILIQLATVNDTIGVEGVVMWVRPPMPSPQFPPGMGVKFTRVSPEARDLLQRTIEERKRRLSRK